MKRYKEDAIQALATAASLTTEETEHRLLRYCHDLLCGDASMEVTADMLVAHAKQSTNEVHFNERLAAAYALDGRHTEAVDALRVAAEALQPIQGLRIVPTRSMTFADVRGN